MTTICKNLSHKIQYLNVTNIEKFIFVKAKFQIIFFFVRGNKIFTQ